MPKTEVVFFAEDDGSAPSLEWLDGLAEKVQNKLIVRIERLAAMGHQLRRPEADYLRDRIYQLRVRHLRVNYRLLYFFHGRRAVLCHGLTKQKAVPERDIDVASDRRRRFRRDPAAHTYAEEFDRA